jgi:predicted RNA-binding protein associated with RNAse of E/G family
MTQIKIVKHSLLGKPPFEYAGELVERGEDHIVVRAVFKLGGVTIIDIPVHPGDRFLETYYRERWYNIYEIRSAHGDTLKGWYCNISYPAQISAEVVSFRDLALDLVVYPDGRQVVLDEDEFATLQIPEEDRRKALQALKQLQDEFIKKFPQ